MAKAPLTHWKKVQALWVAALKEFSPCTLHGIDTNPEKAVLGVIISLGRAYDAYRLRKLFRLAAADWVGIQQTFPYARNIEDPTLYVVWVLRDPLMKRVVEGIGVRGSSSSPSRYERSLKPVVSPSAPQSPSVATKKPLFGKDVDDDW